MYLKHECLTIETILDYLDGRGLILTDDDLLDEALKEMNISFDTQVNETQ